MSPLVLSEVPCPGVPHALPLVAVPGQGAGTSKLPLLKTTSFCQSMDAADDDKMMYTLSLMVIVVTRLIFVLYFESP
jgi:hypothetical protein